MFHGTWTFVLLVSEESIMRSLGFPCRCLKFLDLVLLPKLFRGAGPRPPHGGSLTHSLPCFTGAYKLPGHCTIPPWLGQGHPHSLVKRDNGTREWL